MANDVFIKVDDHQAIQAFKQLAVKGQPGGSFSKILMLAAGMFQRYVLGIVHVDTGRLKNSMFVDGPHSQGNDLFAWVATNVEYAPHEEARGGGHAFFRRAIAEEGPAIQDLFAREARRDLLQ